MNEMTLFVHVPIRFSRTYHGRRYETHRSFVARAIRLIGPERVERDRYGSRREIYADIAIPPEHAIDLAVRGWQRDGSYRVSVQVGQNFKSLRPFVESGERESIVGFITEDDGRPPPKPPRTPAKSTIYRDL
jgi:hypothetical protein